MAWATTKTVRVRCDRCDRHFDTKMVRNDLGWWEIQLPLRCPKCSKS